MNKQPEVTAATRKGFLDAFWTLYQKKRIEKISISEITKISGNNRSTFYNYFIDVYDLLEQAEEEVVESISTELEQYSSSVCNPAIQKLNLDSIYRIISPIFLKYEDRLYALLGPEGDPKFTEKLKTRLIDNLIRFSILPEDIPHKDYILTYIYSSIIGLLTYWRQNDHDLPEEEFLKLAQSLTGHGILGLMSTFS